MSKCCLPAKRFIGGCALILLVGFCADVRGAQVSVEMNTYERHAKLSIELAEADEAVDQLRQALHWLGEDAAKRHTAVLKALQQSVNAAQDEFMRVTDRFCKRPRDEGVAVDSVKLAGQAAAIRKAADEVLDAVRESEAFRKRWPGFVTLPEPEPASKKLSPDGKTSGLITGICGGGHYLHDLARWMGSDYDGLYAPVAYEKWTDVGQLTFRERNVFKQGRFLGPVPWEVILPYNVHSVMPIPAWFWKENWQDESLAVFGAPFGKKKAEQGKMPPCPKGLFTLDHRNPKVAAMRDKFIAAVVKHFSKSPRVLYYKGVWENKWGLKYAYTRDSIGLFHGHLRDKYRTIKELNSAWRTDYANFASITPPPLPKDGGFFDTPNSPLWYEFVRWHIDDYAGWLGRVYQVIKRNDPRHPVVIDSSSQLFGGNLKVVGMDTFKACEVGCDIIGMHGSNDDFEERYVYSLKRALGKTTACTEYIFNGWENRAVPTERETIAIIQRNNFRMWGMGRQILDLYGVRDTYWSGGQKYIWAHNNLADFRTRPPFLAARLCAGSVAVSKRKGDRINSVLRAAPIVEPKVAVLQPDVSIISERPISGTVYAFWSFGPMLRDGAYHYCFLSERRVMEGKDDLADYEVLLLPYATHFPPGFADELLQWVKNGGTLIAAGPFGLFDPYGRPDGKAMKTIFGAALTAEQQGRTDRWLFNLSGRKAVPILEAAYGKGRVLASGDGRAFGRIPAFSAYLPTSAAQAQNNGRFVSVLMRGTVRDAVSVDGQLDLILREDAEGNRYLMAINPHGHHGVGRTVVLRGAYKYVMDLTMPGGFPAPVEHVDSCTLVRVNLRAGQALMLALGKEQSGKSADELDKAMRRAALQAIMDLAASEGGAFKNLDAFRRAQKTSEPLTDAQLYPLAFRRLWSGRVAQARKGLKSSENAVGAAKAAIALDAAGRCAMLFDQVGAEEMIYQAGRLAGGTLTPRPYDVLPDTKVNPLPAARAPAGLKLDGDLTEWADCKAQPMLGGKLVPKWDHGILTPYVEKEAEKSHMVVASAWDKDNLYLALNVPEADPAEPVKVTLYFDALDLDQGQNRFMLDRGVAVTVKAGEAEVQWAQVLPGDPGATVDASRAAVSKLKSGVGVEIAISRKDIPMCLMPGSSVGVNVGVNYTAAGVGKRAFSAWRNWAAQYCTNRYLGRVELQ